jgi:hypothetical protein
VKYYSLDANTLFSWDSVRYGTLANHVNMTKVAVMHHGRFCKSGVASRFSSSMASCYNIDSVSLSNDKDGSKIKESPIKCATNLDKVILCQYRMENYTTPRFSLPCDCSYNTADEGYCPLPGQDFMTTHGQLIYNALNQSHSCHTMDRFDLKAHKDCGIPASNPDDIESFYRALDTQFQVQYWSMLQGTDREAYDCLSGVMPFSSLQVMA